MKTNRICIGLLSALLLTTACENQSKFEINGTITEAADSVLYLENMSLDGPQTVDSVKLTKDGAFAFRENATDAPEFYRLRIAGQIINLSVDSTETVTVKAAYPSMAYKYDVEGSENCKKIQELALLQMKLQSQVNTLIQDQNLSVAQINDSLPKLINAYKHNVRMNYIYKEPNMSYAYFALFQTLVVGYNQALLFNPKYDKEDVKCFAAVATSWDVFHPGAVRGENLHNIAVEGMKDERIVASQNQDLYVDADKVNTTNVLDIELPDNKGNIRHLSDLKGQVVMLDFCSFNQQGVAERTMAMRELYGKYKARGFEIFQVSIDDNQHFWKTQSASLPWVSVNDQAGKYLQSFNVFQIPTFYLISRDGTPYKRDMQIEDLDKEINTLLNQK